jgi:predicted patatin/cPLA2 family phospholipase
MAATEAASSIADAAASATKRRRRMRSTLPLAETLEHRPVRVEHATLQVLRQRALGGSLPGARRDPFKLGLVVEGGGMRGCVSGGALQALADLGLLNIFDSVYGSSAGAINLTFFLSGQRDGVRIYHDHIANEDFVDLRRLFSRRPEQSPALNLPYLLEHVMEKVQPLDYDAVLSSQIPLKVVASSLDTLNPVLLDNFQDKHDLRLALQASATVPAVAGGPVHYRGQRLVDAAVFEPVPFRSAIADGCTHVLVLCTRPAPPARRSVWADAFSDAVESAVKRAVMSPEYMVPAWQAEVEALAKDGITQDEMLRRSLDDGAEELPWFAGTHVYPVYPHPAGCSFSPLCIDVNTLKSGVAEGRRAVLNVARAALGDALDFSRLVGQEAANIVPVTAMSQGQLTTGAGRRLLREHYVFNGRR